MGIRVVVNVASRDVVLQECAAVGATPVVVKEVRGLDGTQVVEIALAFGPPTINLITALVLLWKERFSQGSGRAKERLTLDIEPDDEG